ncbi:MAG: hypothetical protein R2912_04330 [Eubacteriales bacterium]
MAGGAAAHRCGERQSLNNTFYAVWLFGKPVDMELLEQWLPLIDEYVQAGSIRLEHDSGDGRVISRVIKDEAEEKRRLDRRPFLALLTRFII